MAAKIAIAIPSHDLAPVAFASDLAAMAIYSRAALDPEVSLGVTTLAGTYIHSARRRMLKLCIAAKCTHILWLDSDMRFPPDALVQLLNRNLPLIGINYAQRVFPTDFVAFERLSEEGNTKLATLPDSTGVVPVDALGFGCLLMRQDVFKVLPPLAEDPWFGFDWRPDENEVGEDVHFCRMIKARGIQPYVDQDLSKQCGHSGMFHFTLGMVPISQRVVEDERAAKAREQVTVA